MLENDYQLLQYICGAALGTIRGADKIDRLESTINPSEQQFLKDRVDEIYYKQTSLSNEEDRLDALEGKIRKLEKRLGQIVPDSNSAEEELEAKPAE